MRSPFLYNKLGAVSKLNRRLPAGRRRLRAVVFCSTPLERTIRQINSSSSSYPQNFITDYVTRNKINQYHQGKIDGHCTALTVKILRLTDRDRIDLQDIDKSIENIWLSCQISAKITIDIKTWDLLKVL